MLIQFVKNNFNYFLNYFLYFKKVNTALDSFNLMLERANDLITYRIDAILDEIATMTLCDLPDDEPILPDKFLQQTQVKLRIKRIFRFSFSIRNYVIKHQNKFK